MRISKLLRPLLVGLVLLPLAPGTAAASPLEWRLCKDIANRWSQQDERTECAMVTVPVDYAKPDGRTLGIAISRVKASGRRDGVVLLNPGGPGGSGMGMPGEVLRSQAAGIGEHHDLIGFAPRGVSYSGAMACADDWTQPDPSLSPKEKARFTAERDGRNHQRCVATDPEFVRNLTTATIARDVDRIRQALGEDKIGYYGISWGTALGAQYRTLFDQHVDKMLLDSVMPPALDMLAMDRGQLTARENTFHEFTAWLARNNDVYRFGVTAPGVDKALKDLRAKQTHELDVFDDLVTSARRDWPESARRLAALRDGATRELRAPARQKTMLGWDGDASGFNPFQQTSVMCNDSGSTRDFEEIWQHRLALVADLPVAGPYPKYDDRCVGWPLPATPWRFTSGTSPLQLVGHATEEVTPIAWAREMHARIGGALLTVDDDRHGSLMDLPCAAKAVEFFNTGKTAEDSCPGAPVPPARG
ncbi:pimeloyl-ACP methyl ester carboxylesterase [Crossiella equi]|uniref:Pimeloyl-ACP methyl ester carboxylesterase n=1 Tax=Crossiella equi TaxID=130796 RepID=A0ABS5AKT8_9PSEU|nr:alpha/beta fold hydrolase [Crossiella equi]MBP2477184.1 pimeloyl-ACP methyl ester carboxylesterase [Crossiella equi]